MSCISLRLAVGFITFTIGVALSSLGLFHTRPVLKPFNAIEPVTFQSPESQRLSFSSRMDACGPKANYHSFESSDGVFISQSNEMFPSARRAKKELQERLSLATEIIERDNKLGKDGRVVGERVVGVSNGKEGQQMTFIMWTDGEVLSSIEAPSMRHILEFEKR